MGNAYFFHKDTFIPFYFLLDITMFFTVTNAITEDAITKNIVANPDVATYSQCLEDTCLTNSPPIPIAPKAKRAKKTQPKTNEKKMLDFIM